MAEEITVSHAFNSLVHRIFSFLFPSRFLFNPIFTLIRDAWLTVNMNLNYRFLSYDLFDRIVFLPDPPYNNRECTRMQVLVFIEF